jgi:hypothetical protein
MYEHQRAVSVSYLHVIKQLGNDSFAEQIAKMGAAQLQTHQLIPCWSKHT